MKLKKLIKLLKSKNPNAEVLICGRPDLLFQETDYQNALHIIPKDLIAAKFRTPVKEETK